MGIKPIPFRMNEHGQIANITIRTAHNEWDNIVEEMEQWNAPQAAIDAFSREFWKEKMHKAIADQDREAAQEFAWQAVHV